MTEAVSAAQTKLAVEIDGVWEYFKEVKTVPAVGESAATLDATNFDSEMKEYIKDIPDQQAELTFAMNAMPADAPDSNYILIEKLSGNGTYRWKIEYPQLGIQAVIKGQWSWNIGEGAVSSVMEYGLTIIPKSKPIISRISSTYTVAYDPNGGTGTMTDSNSPYANGAEVTVQANTFTPPAGKIFVNWNTRADNSGTSYDASDSFNIYTNTTLYAVWSD
jgi:hypothetical protein